VQMGLGTLSSNDYFCDTGASETFSVSTFYFADPLWLWVTEHLLLFQQSSVFLQAAASSYNWRYWDEAVHRWSKK
jgi:hypothetical protein